MIQKKCICLICIIVVMGLLISGCSTGEAEKKEGLQIVTSMSILADIAENIVGERGTVDFLVPIGDNPEDYEPLPSDMQKVSTADLLILNGWSLEEGIERSMGNITENTVFVTAGITPIPLVGEDVPDPHAWLNAEFVADYYVENILKALIRLDPDGAAEYTRNAAAYTSELKELDAWIKEQAEKIHEANRVIVISENALKYFGEAYGFQTEGIWELNSHEEGTPQQMSRVVDLVVERGIPAVFVESTVDQRYMKIISNEAGVPLAGEIFTDALGLPGSGADTYIKMMEYNTELIVQGLS